MALPYYVSPDQAMEDRSNFVRKGISKAREVIVLEYRDGIVMVAENPMTTVFKISEIYDRIAFAATGLYREYESLRFVGIREAEIKGLTYTRQDVTAKWLTSLYSQYIGASFWSFDSKPLEVELLVCEVKESAEGKNRIYHLSFDGTFWEDQDYAVIGGRSEEILQSLEEGYEKDLDLATAIRLAIETFKEVENNQNDETPYDVSAETVEAAVLDANLGRRKFRRLTHSELSEILS